MLNKKGFTLIELLIVITVIGILATMLMPNLSAAQDKAKEAAVKSVMHTLQLAVETYSIDESVYPAGTNLALEDLYPALSENGHLKSLPKNPFTGLIYTAADTGGQIYYSYDGAENKYTLTAYGRKNDNPVLILTNI